MELKPKNTKDFWKHQEIGIGKGDSSPRALRDRGLGDTLALDFVTPEL